MSDPRERIREAIREWRPRNARARKLEPELEILARCAEALLEEHLVTTRCERCDPCDDGNPCVLLEIVKPAKEEA